jgi:hypothetical protein
MTSANEIAIPEPTAGKIRKNFDMLDRQQVALNNFIEGVAAGLGVPDGYRLDVERMVWCAVAAPTAVDAAADATLQGAGFDSQVTQDE